MFLLLAFQWISVQFIPSLPPHAIGPVVPVSMTTKCDSAKDFVFCSVYPQPDTW